VDRQPAEAQRAAHYPSIKRSSSSYVGAGTVFAHDADLRRNTYRGSAAPRRQIPAPNPDQREALIKP